MQFRSGTRPLSWLLSLLLLLCLILPSAASEAPAAQKRDAILYDADNGMPFSEALSLAQTPDGFVYVGCYGGLLRYDGRTFERLDNIFTAEDLLADAAGRLWVAADGAFCYENGSFRRYTTEDGLPSNAVRGLAEDARGSVYFATASGLAWMDTTGRFHTLADARLGSLPIADVCAAEPETVYGCTDGGAVFRVQNGAVTAFRDGSELSVFVTCLYPDAAHPGKVYLGTAEGTLLYGDPAAPPSELRSIETPELGEIRAMRFADGALWICAENGIAWLDDSGEAQALRHVPMTEDVCDVICDHEGNLWFASSRQGVLKLSSAIFSDISGSVDGFGSRVVNSTWYRDGLLYVGTDTGLLVLDETLQKTQAPVLELLGQARVRAIKGDRQGNIWFCSFDANALVCLKPDGELLVWNKENGLLSNYCRTIYERQDGTLALSVSGGVQIFQDFEIVRTIGSSDGLVNSTVLSICEDRDGTLYLGTNGDGVYVADDDGAAPFPGFCDLSSGVVLMIKDDPTRDRLWILTSNAVAVLQDGAIRTETRFPMAHIYDILFSDGGDLWLMAANAVFVIPKDQVDSRTPAAAYLSYGASSGISHMTTPNSRNCVTPEGIAYVACTDGILSLDVNRMRNDAVRLRFAVPYVEIDGKRIFPDETGTLTVPASAKRVTLHCFALSYAQADPELSYWLEGFDAHPYHTVRSALSPVSYTNLPGGSYTFRMTQGSVADPEAGSVFQLRLVKEPTLRESPWFWVLAAAAFLLLAALLTWFLLHHQAVKAARKRENERIAKELQTAATLQAELLPNVFPAFPERNDFELYASMEPAKEVGGDFYDYFLINEDHLVLVMADISGKGIPAALFMMLSRTLLKSAAQMGMRPSQVLREVNAQLCENNKNNMFVTVWLGILELSTGKLVYADAGHERPFLYHAGSWQCLKKHDGVALALMEPDMIELEEDPPFVDQALTLSPGDVLLQYTDGVTEAINQKQELFGLERLQQTLDRADPAPQPLLGELRAALKRFAGAEPQFDDITMLAVRYWGADGKGGRA